MLRNSIIGMCLIVGCVGMTWAAVPQTLSYQGYLKNTDGTPVNVTTTVKFALYSSTSGGGPVWDSGTVSLTPANGIYSVQLGDPPQPPLPSFDRPYWLGVTAGTDPEMRPLQPLSSAPYALHAKIADAVLIGTVTDNSISGTISAEKLDLSTVVARAGDTMTGGLSLPANGFTIGANQLVAIGDKVGIGTASPAEKLEVAGTIKATSIIGEGAGITNIKYAKVAVVGHSGANYISPISAMADIAAWCGTPSATNPCMVKILPGVYDLGATSLAMEPYVDIEGSGENVTVLAGAVSTAYPPPNGVVNGASNAEIRLLTIKNTSTGHVAAILNSGASLRMAHVTAIALGGTDNYGIYNYFSSPTMSNVNATASGENYNVGVFNYVSSPIMSNVTVTASGGTNNKGVLNSDSSPTMDSVTATGSGGDNSWGIYNTGSSGIMSNVNAIASGGTNNIGVTNTSGASPIMSNVTATALGGDNNYGVINSYSAFPTMSNVTARASGGTNSWGLYNYSSLPIMDSVTATASEATNNYGMYNYGAFRGMSKVTATGKLGSVNYGMYNDTTPSQTVLIEASSFEGSTGSIYNDTPYTLKIGSSKLIGPRPAIGTILYLASYSDTTILGSAMTGLQTFETGGATSKGVVVKGAAGQTANLQEWQDNSGTVKASVSATGEITGSMSTTSLTGTLDVLKGGTGQPSLTASKLVVGNGISSVLTPASLHWDDTNNRLGLGTINPNEQLELTGNLRLPATTATSGMIRSGANTLLHTYGGNNFFAGLSAGNLTTTGGSNTASGYYSLNANTTGTGNTASGSYSLYANTTGHSNTASGSSSLNANTTGSGNTASGSYSLNLNTTGSYNTASGYISLNANTTGSYNTANGISSLYANTAGFYNTASGSSSLYANTTGSFNTAIGDNALGTQSYDNAGTSWNSFNTAVGASALQYNQPTGTTNGIRNTALGALSIRNNTTGYDNTAIGYQAGNSQTTGSNNIYIGSKVLGVAGESDTIRVGNSSAQTFISGVYGKTSAAGLAVYVNSSGLLGTATSSRRFKEDILDMGDATDALMKLRPVSFRYRHEYADGSRLRQYGLIAEEVADVFPEVVAYDDKGTPYTVYYQFINAMLLNEVQKQHRTIDSQAMELQEQKDLIRALEARLSRVEAVLNAR